MKDIHETFLVYLALFIIYAGLIAVFLLFVCNFIGCDLLSANDSIYKTLYENSQQMLVLKEKELVERRASELQLRNSLDSLYRYVDFKTDSLFSVIAIKDILINSYDANIDTMLWDINNGVINYINKLRAKCGLDSL